MKRKVYFDNAATTPLSKRVKEAMIEAMEEYGNPSSLHMLGFEAEQKIKQSTKILAELLRVEPAHLFYTSGGTESNNTAIFGSISKRRRKIVTTAIEHPSIGEAVKVCQQRTEGVEVVALAVDKKGRIDLDELEKAVDDDTAIVSIGHVNSETGAIQPIEEIGAIIKKCSKGALFHVDAVQSFGKFSIPIQKGKIDLLSVSGHKIHGPKGIGLLYKAPKIVVQPFLIGGGQQSGFRSGTENTLAIAGMTVAAEEAFTQKENTMKKMIQLRKTLWEGLKIFPDVHINGDKKGSPYILNVSFEGIRSEVLLHSLEAEGIYVSAGSACSSKQKTSSILVAHGLQKSRVESALRFSFSRFNTIGEIEETLEVLSKILPILRRHKGVK